MYFFIFYKQKDKNNLTEIHFTHDTCTNKTKYGAGSSKEYSYCVDGAQTWSYFVDDAKNQATEAKMAQNKGPNGTTFQRCEQHFEETPFTYGMRCSEVPE